MGGGVLKVQRTVSASTPPVADSVPAGIDAVYSVAIGRRSMASESYSKVSVLVPNHFHVPGSSGCSRTGTSPAAKASRVAKGTMGWLKVTFRKGARGISPSGAKRNTSRGPASTCSGATGASGGGKGSSTVSPVRGGGGESSGRCSTTCSSGSEVRAGSRARIWATSSSDSGSPLAGGRKATSW